MECLSQLRDARLLEFRWEIFDDAENGTEGVKGEGEGDRGRSEMVRVLVRGGSGEGEDGDGFEFVEEERREYRVQARNPVKHRVATRVLERILGGGKDWENMTILDMKDCVRGLGGSMPLENGESS